MIVLSVYSHKYNNLIEAYESLSLSWYILLNFFPEKIEQHSIFCKYLEVMI